MKSKLQTSLVLVIALMIGTFTVAFAQTEEAKESQKGWAARALEARARRQAEREAGNAPRIETITQTDTEEESQADADTQTEAHGWQQSRRPEPLVGTWLIDVVTSDAGFPPFRAYHTFHDGGTFTEVSNLLSKLNETPAHGAWTGRGSRYNLTFELFVFDDKKEPIGIVRVRVAIRLLSQNKLVGDTTVDFIAPDGTIEKEIDGGPFSGKRVKVLPVR